MVECPDVLFPTRIELQTSRLSCSQFLSFRCLHFYLLLDFCILSCPKSTIFQFNSVCVKIRLSIHLFALSSRSSCPVRLVRNHSLAFFPFLILDPTYFCVCSLHSSTTHSLPVWLVASTHLLGLQSLSKCPIHFQYCRFRRFDSTRPNPNSSTLSRFLRISDKPTQLPAICTIELISASHYLGHN
jgi:hypothetical protein